MSFTRNLAIDLGTRNIVITCDDKVLIDDEAVIAVCYRSDGTPQMCAYGRKARQGLFRADIRIIRPFKDGRIEDPVLFDLMYTAFVKEAVYRSYPKWVRFLIDIPGAFRESPALWVYLGIFLSIFGWIIYCFNF